MLDGFNPRATLNPDIAYLIGFSVIVLGSKPNQPLEIQCVY